MLIVINFFLINISISEKIWKLVTMNAKMKHLNFSEIIVLSPIKHKDKRGLFFENFNSKDFKKETGNFFNIFQENISFSKKNVLRGLHFQKGYHSQSKLISVVRGKIFDVIVDIRENSHNFGKWTSYILDDSSHESLFIPSGFAHGFLSLDNNTMISYKVDKPYNKNSECSIIWNDDNILIDWPCNKPILSEKDQNALTFDDNYKLNKFKV